MSAHKPLVALFVMLLRSSVVLFVSAPAFAQTSGTLTVLADTVLSANHNGDVVIAADNVTLDCAGRTISGGGLVERGISVELRTGVTIKNCKVTGFIFGVLLLRTTNSVLTANTASGNTFGFALMFSSENQVLGNFANQNALSGFAPGASSGNTFTGNTANQNGRNGFEIHLQADFNTFTDNTANGNAVFGIALSSSSNNTFERNVAHFNVVSGFSLALSSNLNYFRDNTARHNPAGVDVRLSSANTFLENAVRNNILGFYFENSSSNIVRDNNACPNRELDLFQDAASTANVFENNRFCQTSGL